MKNFKKIIILGGVLLGVIILLFYKTTNNNDFEEFNEDNIIIQEEKQNEEENIVIHITGEVNNPGVVKLEKGARVADAVEKSGGLTNEADQNKINLAYILSDGQKIYVPSIYDKEEVEENNALEFSYEKSREKININTATQTELETLTGIGPSTALKIINYRKENGGFKSIDEIKNVPGIGESKFEAIKDEICI